MEQPQERSQTPVLRKADRAIRKGNKVAYRICLLTRTFLLLHDNYGVTTRKFTIEYDYTNASSKQMHVSVTLETTESYVTD